MDDKLICAAAYLSYEEGISLFNRLEEAGIPAFVKSCGPPSFPFGEGVYFQLLVPEKNLEEANEITKAFREELKESKLTEKCPRCNAEAVFQPKNLPFWQKLYYAGTRISKCRNCGKMFPS